MDDKLQTRRGVAKNLTIDFDAAALLEELASGKNCQGRLLSELIRAEKVRREERARLRAVVNEVLA